KMVCRLPEVDDHSSVRPAGAGRKEQPWHLLGNAGGRIRPPYQQSRADGLLQRSIQDRSRAQPDRGRRQLPARAEKDEALWLLPVQSRGYDDGLPDTVDARG